ncbi:SCO family protein [Ramlibacter sp. GTP1]|uniref:SCO family protein n=2 Tax=Ramlibacter albus TaxID=2079448 RepID=A0A923MAM0_9BURK|nr:SCO family protein [Ramlibacter albus]
MDDLMNGRGPIGGPFTLQGVDGRPVRLADFSGKVVLLYFGYTGCADVCPTDLVQMARLLSLLGKDAAQVQPVFVTLDPQRDTAAVVREYVKSFDARIVGLRGSEAETRRVATAYKVAYEKVPATRGYFIDHTAFFYLLDPAGRYVAFMPPGTSAERMLALVKDNLGLLR